MLKRVVKWAKTQTIFQPWTKHFIIIVIIIIIIIIVVVVVVVVVLLCCVWFFCYVKEIVHCLSYCQFYPPFVVILLVNQVMPDCSGFILEPGKIFLFQLSWPCEVET